MTLPEVIDILNNVRFDYVATCRDCHRLRKSKTDFKPEEFIIVNRLDEAIRSLQNRCQMENLDKATESLIEQLESEKEIVNRVWAELGIKSLSEAKNYTVWEYVKWLRQSFKSCVKAFKPCVFFMEDYLKHNIHVGVSRLTSDAKEAINEAERFTQL